MEYRYSDKKHHVKKDGVFQSNYVSEHGRSRANFTCPFCEKDTTAFIFSIHGGGKKCDHCDDVVLYIGSAWKKFKTEVAAHDFIKNKDKDNT